MGVERPEVLTASAPDVVVVGGGPSGLVAAADLAAQGASVLVLEEHDRVGAPVHCTGVLGMDAFDELRLPRTSVLNIVESARFVSADGSDVRVAAERIRAAVIDRVRFDSDLAESAGTAGAVLRAGVRVTAIRVEPRHVAIDTTRGGVRSRAVILACGASYRFNRDLGLGLPGVLAHSAQVEVPFPALDDVEVHLGSRVSAGGFGWVVPFRRGSATFARVGLLSSADAPGHFAALARSVRRQHGITGEWPEPRVKVLPLSPAPRTWSDRVLAVGDAAGLVKPTTGGGIYYGLLTGRIAASVLTGALARDALTSGRLHEYERRWRGRLGADIRAGLAFRAVAARLSDRAIDTLMEIARVDGIVPLLKQTADFNWHGAAALSILRNASFRRVVFGSIWS